jgi:uncharacterized metal-binding protein
MKNKLIAASFAVLTLVGFGYAIVNDMFIKAIVFLMIGLLISGIFYVVYDIVYNWLESRDNKRRAAKANKAYFDKIRNMKSKPPRK